jgi:hypothetical protein
MLGKASSGKQAQDLVMSIQKEMLATLDGSESSVRSEANGDVCGGAGEEDEGGGHSEGDDLVSYDALVLGMRLHEQGRFKEALDVLRRVLALRRTAHKMEGGHPETEDVLVEIAKVLLAAGEELGEAAEECRETLQEALHMRRAAFGGLHREVAVVYSLLGQAES